MAERVAVILAGGQGRRLSPYTEVLPKPLVPVGGTPILEIVVGQLQRAGFQRVVLAVNHLERLIRSYFEDGASFGLEIEYSREGRSLGTVGPLLPLCDQLPEHFLVMNGDVLCDVAFAEVLARHTESGRTLTLCTHTRTVNIQDGVIDTGDGGLIRSFREKPTIELLVSMGVYAMSRSALGRVPADVPFGMDDLVRTMLDAGVAVGTHHHRGEWYDIGSPQDLQRATEAFTVRPDRFGAKPQELLGTTS